jgi:hypothetical protein
MAFVPNTKNFAQRQSRGSLLAIRTLISNLLALFSSSSSYPFFFVLIYLYLLVCVCYPKLRLEVLLEKWPWKKEEMISSMATHNQENFLSHKEGKTWAIKNGIKIKIYKIDIHPHTHTHTRELRQSPTKDSLSLSTLQVQHTHPKNDGLNVCVLCVTGESLGDI